MGDDLLGQQQDDIARLRYELSKLAGADDTLAGCQSAFDVFRRLTEQGKRNLVSVQLSDSLRALKTDFDAKPWVDKLLASIDQNNQVDFERIHRQAILAASV